MKSLNAPVNYNMLVAVRSMSKSIKEDGNSYYSLELQSFAVSNNGKWESPTDIFSSTTKLNMSETFYKLWLKGKDKASNVLLLTVEHTIKDVTEYENELGDVLNHSITSLVLKQVLQATIFDVVNVNQNVSLGALMEYMITSINRNSITTLLD